MIRVLCLAFLLLPAVAHAQDTPRTDLAEEADLQFELGIDAYRSGAYRDALEHLLASNRLVPNKNVVYNIARTYEKLEKFPDAYRHYSDYLELEQDPAERKSAEDALARIGQNVALVRVSSDPPGAVVYVDRVDLGARGSTPRVLALEPGVHRVIIEHEGDETATVEGVDVQVGATKQVDVKLVAILGTVRVEGGPAGAAIRVDHEDSAVVGTVPASIAVPPGSHVLMVSAPGYQTALQVVDVTAKQTAQALVALQPVTGTVVVGAAERGALIEIDGAAAGFTPAVLPTVPAGPHHVKVSLRGYHPFEADIEVKENQPVEVSARLRPLQEVTAASRTAQAIEDAPASVSLISAQEIRAFGYESVYEALGGTRGVYQTNDHTYEYIGFRGFSRLGNYNNRQLMTLDGHTLNDDQLGGSYFGHDLMADLLDVEQIEVVRGPGSALYGTNAFSGVVNLVTRSRDTTQPSNIGIATYDAANVRGRVGVSKDLGNDTGVWASAGGIVAQGARALPNDGFVSGTFDARFWHHDVNVQAYWNTRAKQQPNGNYETILGDPRSVTQDSRAALELRWEPKLGENARFYGRLYGDHYEYHGGFPYADDDTFVLLWDGSWVGVEPRLVAQPLKALRITAGTEARAYLQAVMRACDLTDPSRPTTCSPDGPYFVDEPLDKHPTSQVAAGYAVIDWLPTPVLTASVGGRLDWFSSIGENFNPRVSVILKPGESDTVKLLGGTAFRAPSPYELYYEDGTAQKAPADGLLPETIRTAEVEYTHRFSDVTTLTGAAYGNETRNAIDTVDLTGDDAGYFAYTNFTDVVQRTVGVEAEIRRDWRQGSMIALTYSGQRTRLGDLVIGDAISNSPEHIGSLKVAGPIGPATLANRLIVESSRLTDLGESTRPILLDDVIITGTVAAIDLDYGVGIRNVFGWRYDHPTGPDVSFGQTPQTGRNLYATATIRF
jgi:outer membrane receptor protein involved in Fe transport